MVNLLYELKYISTDFCAIYSIVVCAGYNVDTQGATCFHWAAKRGDYSILTLLKSYYGAVLDAPASCENQMRPQHWGASDGKIASMKFFLDNRVDLNCPDGNGCSPLAVAVQYMHTETALYLIKNGADLALKDTNGDSVLHWAAYKGAEELVGMLVHFMPREVDTEDHFGQAAIHLAALGGHHRVVEYLLRENGAVFNKTDKNGMTPLDLAMKRNQTSVEYVIRRFSSADKLDFLRKLGCGRLFKVRFLLPYFLCGFDDRERGAWMWRATFFPNLVASLISIYYVTCPEMADTGLLQLASTVCQLAWWTCFLLLLYFPASYVVEIGVGSISPGGGSANNSISSYDKALDRIAEMLNSDTPATAKAGLAAGMPTVCHTCHVVRPLRSKHCKVMRRCVHKFDHYCPFVYNAVSRDNYKYFIGVLMTFPPSYLLFLASTYIYWKRMGPLSWCFIIFLVYSAILFMMVLGLLSYHFGLITTNLTTNEEINMHRYAYLHNEFSRYSNPFDKYSRWNNFWDGMFPSNKSFFSREEVLDHRKAEDAVDGLNGRSGRSNSDGEEESFLHSGDVKAKLMA